MGRWGGDDAVRADDLSEDRVVALAVELGIRQHAAHGRHGSAVTGLLKQRTQRRPVVGRTRRGHLRQDQPARQIDHDDPLEPVAPDQPVSMVAHPVDEAGADRPGRQARSIDRDRDRRPLVRGRRHPAHGLVQQMRPLVLAGTAQTPVQRGVVESGARSIRSAVRRSTGSCRRASASR
jgi:hypothetical protein